MKKIIILILITGIGYYTYKQYNKLQGLEYIKIENIALTNNGPPDFSVQLDADTYWENPNSIGAHIISMDFDVNINNQFITRIKEDLDLKVPANDVFTLPLSISIPILKGNLLKNASELLTGAWKKRAIEVHLRGTFKIKKLELSIPIPFDIKTKIRIDDYLY